MIGRATASLEEQPRRWLQRLWGVPDIHLRQQWHVIWPALARLPQAALRVIDAGTGRGTWALECARRRPAWRITGIDRVPEAVAAAERARRRLGLENVAFAEADFLTFEPDRPVDLVLSVNSSHYLAADGGAAAVFRAFASWLAPGGLLLLYGPRCGREVPTDHRLPPPFQLREVFTRGQLLDACEAAGLEVVSLAPSIGRYGTLAKQLAGARAKRPMLAAPIYAAQLMLSGVDRLVGVPNGGTSAAWLLAARRRQG